MSRLLDYNPLTGESVTFDWNDEEGTFTIGHHCDMQPFLDANERHRIEGDSKAEIKKGWMKLAAGITNPIILKWRQEHGVDFFNQEHWPRVLELLNSREYRKLKCTDLIHNERHR